MNHILTTIASVILSIGSFLGVYHPPVAPTVGAYNPTGGGTYRLQSSIGGSSTSVTLTSFKEPVSGIKYTMSYLNSSIEYATIEPQSTSKEFVSFTGITQNSDGSATLTGLSRGLGFSYPYTASTTLQQSHSAQSILILSNTPQVYNQYANKANNETITGQWTFSVFPITPASPAGSETTSGIVQLATGAQAAAGTMTGSLGRLTLPTAISTSTWLGTTGNLIPVTLLATNKLDNNFISTSTLLAATSTIKVGAFPAWQIGQQRQIITTTGTSTFTVPNGITKVFVRVQAGGGSGLAAQTGSGGGGGYAEKVVDVTGTTSIQVYVSDTGAGAGAAGRWSTFGTNGFYVYATGGGGGTSVAGGAGGCGVNGDFNACGGGGGPSSTNLAWPGGSSVLGGGGRANTNGVGESAGGNYGGGASGCYSSCGGSGGGQGIVIVQW